MSDGEIIRHEVGVITVQICPNTDKVRAVWRDVLDRMRSAIDQVTEAE